MSGNEVPSTNAWLPTGFRDENARLLVRGMLQCQGALLAHHPWVPVQGYAVRDDGEDDDGALTVGALLKLWDRASDLMHGDCSICKGGRVLGFTISGGDPTCILAPCRQCGYLAVRTPPAAELFERFVDALEGAREPRYPVPTQKQLDSMNGLHHTALIGVLRSLGVKLLPPEHYGCVGPAFGDLRYTLNPALAQASVWAYRAIMRHAPTRALVQPTEATWTIARNLAEAELERTGRLPELDYALPDNLMVTFPLISQAEVRPAGRDVVADEDDEDDRGPHGLG